MDTHYIFEKLGDKIQLALADPATNEVILNPDGKLWCYQSAGTRNVIGTMTCTDALGFSHALAQTSNAYLNEKTPYLDAVLPISCARINVTIPPISEGVSFNIRKRSQQILTLSDYVNADIMTQSQYDILCEAINQRKNILVSGGPGSGKTTLTNALLSKIANVVPKGHRILILEQIEELQCDVDNYKRLLTSDHVDMRCLLWIAMRNSPDRIVVGEVRDGAALDMLKAWNTGCPGGIATIHANSATAALQRLVDLACEIIPTAPYSLVAEAVDVIVHIEADKSHKAQRVVKDIVAVTGVDVQTKQFMSHSLLEQEDKQ